MRSGLQFEHDISQGEFVYRAAEFEKNRGFHIELVDSALNLTINFSLETFAADLAESIRSQVELASEEFSVLEDRSLENRDVALRINGRLCASFADALKTDRWQNVSLQLRIEKPAKESDLTGEINYLLTLILLMLPIEELSEAQDFDEEGRVRRGEFNRYERSAKNRRICIALFGFDCAVCGTNMEKTYGELGSDFIHVHHITPVSMMGGSREVNPATELIPLCPNCHYILHRITPPLEPDRLRAILKESGSD